jgi:acetyltransferase-like isoleucine patch superfamily enzyme
MMRWQRRIKCVMNELYSLLAQWKIEGLTLAKGAKIGAGSKIHVEKGGQIAIGYNSHCAANVTVLEGGRVTIGAKTWINSGAVLGCAVKISIGDGVMVAHGVTIYDNNNHPTELEKRIEIANQEYPPNLISWKNSIKQEVLIGDYAWIGMHSIILKGVRVGRGAIVAAGSVVVKDVPEMCVVAGNPAKPVKYLTD